MKRLIHLAFVLLIGYSAQPASVLAQEPAVEEAAPDLYWVGCGISKKAYMVALVKAYEKKTGIKIDVDGGGATRGIRESANMTVDMGGSCRRKILGEETEKDVAQVPVAWDALVAITHKSNPVDDISLNELRQVFLGEVTNWKDLGGNDAPIDVYVRQGNLSGVGRTARKLLFDNYDQEFAADKTFESTGPLEIEVETAPNAIALSGISSAKKRDVKILHLNGKEPSYDNVKTGQYLLYRPLYIVYNKSGPNAKQVEDFLRFAFSEEGRDVIRANGTVPYLEAMNLMRNKLQESDEARNSGGL